MSTERDISWPATAGANRQSWAVNLERPGEQRVAGPTATTNRHLEHAQRNASQAYQRVGSLRQAIDQRRAYIRHAEQYDAPPTGDETNWQKVAEAKAAIEVLSVRLERAEREYQAVADVLRSLEL